MDYSDCKTRQDDVGFAAYCNNVVMLIAERGVDENITNFNSLKNLRRHLLRISVTYAAFW